VLHVLYILGSDGERRNPFAASKATDFESGSPLTCT
jgi:hypothetical protein